MYTLYVHPRSRQVPMNLETGFDRCGHLVPCRNGWLLRPLRSRKGISQLGIPKMRQSRSSLGLGHLRSLRAALYPGSGYVRRTPVQRVHGRHSAGSSRVGARPNTLRIGCTELKAVPHAGLGFHFLRVQVRTPKKEEEVHPAEAPKSSRGQPFQKKSSIERTTR